MNNDNPPIVHGTASPPAKNDFKFRPVRAKSSPIPKTKAEKTKITDVSIIEFKLLVLVIKNYFHSGFCSTLGLALISSCGIGK
jgi:hypothetical protein